MRATSTTHGRLRGHVRISMLDGAVLFEGDNQITDYGNEEFMIWLSQIGRAHV